jgi:hypothetical protein
MALVAGRFQPSDSAIHRDTMFNTMNTQNRRFQDNGNLINFPL